MSVDQWSLLRAEVLRQLVGASSSWAVWCLGILVVFKALDWLNALVKEGKTLTTFAEISSAIRQNKTDKETGKENRYFAVSQHLRSLLVVFLALFAGYHVGYSINSAYISGDISLIVTVDRIVNFYKLILFIFEWVLVFCYLITIYSVHRLQVYANGETARYRLITKFQALLRFVGLLLAFVIPLVAIVLCYVNLVRY